MTVEEVIKLLNNHIATYEGTLESAEEERNYSKVMYFNGAINALTMLKTELLEVRE